MLSFIIIWGPTIIIFILLIALIVLAHELGHFVVAKRAGMTVEEFGFGLPPRIWGKKFRGTLYSINLLPIGGFVRILGEGEERKEKGAFGNKSLRSRIAVVVAGVIMNVVLAYVAVAISFWVGLPPIVTMTSPSVYGGHVVAGSGGSVIREIAPDSLAEKAGILVGDSLAKIDDVEEPNVIDVRVVIAEKQGQDIHIVLNRDGEIIEKDIAIGENEMLGVGLGFEVKKVIYSWWKVPYYALLETGKILWLTIVGFAGLFKSLFVSHVVPEGVGGPVAIFGLTSVVVQLGAAYVLAMLVNLSVSLAILNILPFPALDGGRLVFLLVEKIRGRKVAERVEAVIHNIGFILLLALLVLLTWRDIVRF